MNQKVLSQKYHLPESVQVVIKKNPRGGYYAKFPDYPGCMTEADNEMELLENITDAILTYFEVPREEALKLNIIYLPLRPQLTSIAKPRLSAQFLIFAALHSYGKYPNLR